MSVWSITSKDLQVFIKDRGALVMLFLLPFVFIVVFALIGQNVDLSGGSGVELVPLPVVNADPHGQAAQEFLAALEDTGKIQIVLDEAAAIERRLNTSQIEYALYIPVDFTTSLAAGDQTTLRLRLHPYYSQAPVMAVERAISRASREYLMMVYLNKGLEQMAAMQAASPDSGDTFSQARIQQQVEVQKAAAEQRPLIRVVETVPAAKDEAENQVDIPGLGQTTVVGMAVLFVFLAAQSTAQSFFKEKRLGSFRRLMAAPLSKSSLLAGKLLPNLILSLVQIAVILITGGFLIQLFGAAPLDLSSDPLGLLVASLAIALCSTSLGIFIAAIAKTENQVGGLSTAILFMAALLAGSFVPIFLFPEGIEKLARFVPHYWANQAYYGLIFRNQTLVGIWPNIAALLIFTLAFFLIGLWRFKFD
jgi:ABC-2 type transport system permease protein